MSARHLLDRPDFEIPLYERVEDVLFMVDLLAAWIRVRRVRGGASASILAGTLLCPIFRSEKGAGYVAAADEYRQHFAGIAEQPQRAGDFLSRVQPVVFEITTPREIFGAEFRYFFDDRF